MDRGDIGIASNELNYLWPVYILEGLSGNCKNEVKGLRQGLVF